MIWLPIARRKIQQHVSLRRQITASLIDPALKPLAKFKSVSIEVPFSQGEPEGWLLHPGRRMDFSSVKIPGASCDEIVMANEHRKSLMSLV